MVYKIKWYFYLIFHVLNIDWTFPSSELGSKNFNFIGLCHQTHNATLLLRKEANECTVPKYLGDYLHKLNSNLNLLETMSSTNLTKLMTSNVFYKHTYRKLNHCRKQNGNSNWDCSLVNQTAVRHKQENLGIFTSTKHMINIVQKMLSSGNWTLTKQHIWSLHQRILGNIHPKHAGKWRKQQVGVRGSANFSHIPPEIYDVDRYMTLFLNWFNGPGMDSLHPLERAAMTTLHIFFIHPVMDGNGRLARLLANVVLLRNGLPPLGIEARNKDLYNRFAKLAMWGEPEHFVRLFAEGVLNMQQFIQSNHTMHSKKKGY